MSLLSNWGDKKLQLGHVVSKMCPLRWVEITTTANMEDLLKISLSRGNLFSFSIHISHKRPHFILTEEKSNFSKQNTAARIEAYISSSQDPFFKTIK